MREFIALFFLLFITGCLFSILVHMTCVPFYVCNFVYGVIVAFYVMENWTLMKEIEKIKKGDIFVLDGDLERNMIKLVSKNDVLMKENTQLREALKKERIKRRPMKSTRSESSMGDLEMIEN